MSANPVFRLPKRDASFRHFLCFDVKITGDPCLAPTLRAVASSARDARNGAPLQSALVFLSRQETACRTVVEKLWRYFFDEANATCEVECP